MAHILRFHDQKNATSKTEFTISTHGGRLGSIEATASRMVSMAGSTLTAAELTKWKARLKSLEEKYNELMSKGDISSMHVQLNELLKELKEIMQVQGLEDVVEYQHSLARIKVKVLRIMHKKQQQLNA